MNKPKLLIVDDEFNMRHLIRLYLKPLNFEIDEASEGQAALSFFSQNEYSLIILDLMLPGIDGWEVCRKIREKKEEIPILMLTARGEVKDKVLGFQTGADDYLTKPFSPEELVVRIQALLRRSKRSTANHDQNQSSIQFKDLTINQESREVLVKEHPIELTPKEFSLLALLSFHPKKVFTREILLEQIWQLEDYRDIRTVDTHVKNLREKLRVAGLTYNTIKTIWGVGYKFDQPDVNT